MKSMLMRIVVAAGVTTGGLFSAGPVFASEELFKKSNCLACHAIDQKRLGPSMKDVAAKYNGDGTAAEMLARKIRAGGGGVWGEMAMPAQAQVSEADAKTLAEYILTVK